MSTRPNTADYCDWARAQGFSVDVRPIMGAAQPLLAITITTPEGRKAIEIACRLGDPLMSTNIARLDRALGRKSWLFR